MYVYSSIFTPSSLDESTKDFLYDCVMLVLDLVSGNGVVFMLNLIKRGLQKF